MTLSGNKLAGGNPKNQRVKHDYYATNPKALYMLMNVYKFNQGSFLEPCVGAGHLAHVIKEQYPNSQITTIDIVDRGYPNTIVTDFLTYKLNTKFDNIITNPPYSLADKFVEKGLQLLNPNGKMAMFLKIEFLASNKRYKLFQQYPPKYIYVFVSRMATWSNGKPVDEKGKPWATTMCHAWFIWEEGFKGEPVVRWLK